MTDLADRYGTASRPRRRRALLVAGGLALAVVLGYFGWLVWAWANPAVASGNLTFTVVDDRSAVARFQVDTRDDDVVPTCELRALSADKALVGQLTVRDPEVVDGHVEVRIATERRATTVDLIGCTADGQNRPR